MYLHQLVFYLHKQNLIQYIVHRYLRIDVRYYLMNHQYIQMKLILVLLRYMYKFHL